MILVGDVREVLPTLDASSIHCVVTSPPYWGLRDYGVDCQIGLEGDIDDYLSTMVEVFRGIWRVLREDGTLWLNLGDAYAGVHSKGKNDIPRSEQGDGKGLFVVAGGSQDHYFSTDICRPVPSGLKPKDLCGIPWRVAFALQADGWYLRSDIIWSKPNPMPESVTDRPTKAHEYVFLLTKSRKYYYDADAIREANKPESEERYKYSLDGSYTPGWAYPNEQRDKPQQWQLNPTGRNKRTVWEIPTQPYPDAHFSTFPEALVAPCIEAGSREGDTVLDPFAGSGTTGVVCRKLGREFVGVELNQEYADLANTRIENCLRPRRTPVVSTPGQKELFG
jgi:DNA modification methylase